MKKKKKKRIYSVHVLGLESNTGVGVATMKLYIYQHQFSARECLPRGKHRFPPIIPTPSSCPCDNSTVHI